MAGAGKVIGQYDSTTVREEESLNWDHQESRGRWALAGGLVLLGGGQR